MNTQRVCPVEATAKILGARWTMQILHHLRQPKRFCELQTAVGEVNPRTLAQRLKLLEKEGVIRRTPISAKEHIALYELTEKGRGMLPIIDAIVAWAIQWLGIPTNQAERKS